MRYIALVLSLPTRNATARVRAWRALKGLGCGVFVEVGPRATLLGLARRCMGEGAGALVPSMRPGRGEWRQMAEGLAELYVRGVGVDWAGFDRGYERSAPGREEEQVIWSGVTALGADAAACAVDPRYALPRPESHPVFLVPGNGVQQDLRGVAGKSSVKRLP